MIAARWSCDGHRRHEPTGGRQVGFIRSRPGRESLPRARRPLVNLEPVAVPQVMNRRKSGRLAAPLARLMGTLPGMPSAPQPRTAATEVGLGGGALSAAAESAGANEATRVATSTDWRSLHWRLVFMVLCCCGLSVVGWHRGLQRSGTQFGNPRNMLPNDFGKISGRHGVVNPLSIMLDGQTIRP